MVSRYVNYSPILFTAFLLGVGMIFIVLLGKHYEFGIGDLHAAGRDAQAALTIASARAGIQNPCDEGQTLDVFSATVYVCNEARSELVYNEIYTLYPAAARGRDVLYDFITTGNKTRADEMLENIYDFERFPAAQFGPELTWEEDPYGERYWRFLFYSLRPVRHLLATAEETGSERYYDKAHELLGSFLTNGMDATHSWDDAHGVAFRTMMLVHAWWNLREAGELPAELSDQILAALEIHGDFLMDPENYEDNYNHAVTQSAALLLLAEAFPDLANAENWEETAVRRINIGISSIVDPNGMLAENSPYYHFYALEKYWQIYEYARENSVTLTDNFNDTLERMIFVGGYLLQPDGSVPLQGASIPRTVLRSGAFATMAERHPTFAYSVSQGQRGEVPEANSILFPSSGFAIMRSGWGTERSFGEETYLIFDTGPYRTDHSDLDALTFSLFGNGMPLIRDTGLYTYETENEFYDYFYGTRGHNTVMVDGKNQAIGEPVRRELVAAPSYSIMAAAHELYPGVRHSRTIALIETDTVVILDDLTGTASHRYEQLFHLPPATTLGTTNENQVVAQVTKDGVVTPLTITQLVPPNGLQTFTGEENPPRGLCAEGYEVREPCPELAFTTQATSTRFVTVVQFGTQTPRFDVTYDEETTTLTLRDEATTGYDLTIEFPDEGLLESSYIDLEVTTRTNGMNPLQRVERFLDTLF